MVARSLLGQVNEVLAKVLFDQVKVLCPLRLPDSEMQIPACTGTHKFSVRWHCLIFNSLGPFHHVIEVDGR